MVRCWMDLAASPIWRASADNRQDLMADLDSTLGWDVENQELKLQLKCAITIFHNIIYVIGNMDGFIPLSPKLFL